MRLGRIAVALVATPLVLALWAEPAVAAPPGNDTVAGATPFTPGFGAELDTSEATTDADDAQLNATCGAPATDASVWYALTSASVTPVVVDVSRSSYSAGVLVGLGTPGNLETIICGADTVGFFVNPGYTYYVLAIDDQLDGGGNGGTLRIAVNEAPPLPTVEVTVDPVGRFDARTGIATLTGTYSCTNGDFIQVSGEARQNVGRFTIVGFFGIEDLGTCDGTPRSWSADVHPANGEFAGGTAMTVTFAFTCGPVECIEGVTEQTVLLRGSPAT
jgi:hypothetical protein